MNRWMAQLIDRVVIAIASRGARATAPPNLSEARRILCDPAFFATAPAAKVQRTRACWEFQSHLKTYFPEGNVVRGSCWGASELRGKPAVILIHGWNDELGYRFRLPRIGQMMGQLNWSAWAIQLPMHLQRRPRAGPFRDFISPDLSVSLTALQQSVCDITALTRFLQQEGARSVSLWGTSLGGFIAGLIACHDPSIEHAVLTTPVINLQRAITELEFCRPLKRALAQSDLSLDRLDLLQSPLAMNPSNLLIQAAVHDLFAPLATLEELNQRWPGTQLWKIPGGHISVLFRKDLINRTISWLNQPSPTSAG
jgi:pimeloyl-ACP methyl ester carboxylesterase